MLTTTHDYSTTPLSLGVLLLSLGTVSVAQARDHIVPPMVNIPAGNFMMGTESGDPLAKPMHQVSIGKFRLAKYPVTVAEFRKFAEDTGFDPKPTCKDHIDENWLTPPTAIGTASWDNNRYTKTEYHPVTCVSWQTAKAYAKWLSDKTGTSYRLPTEEEFEYATKANTTSRFFWGDDPEMTQACRYGNFADQNGEYFASTMYGASYVGFLDHANCDDGEPYNAIVGLYRPNPFGLYDMVGNVSQFLGTCYHEAGYRDFTADELDPGKCEFIGHRGDTWHYPPQPHADRGRYKREGWEPGALMGFRLAADAHSDEHNKKPEASTTAFETALKKAQTERLATRPKLPAAPEQLQLIRLKGDNYRLSWQPTEDPRITGYEIYRSSTAYAHKQGQFFKRQYDKLHAVGATQHTLDVTLPEEGGSFRVVAMTDKLTSLPSQPAVAVSDRVVNIPGRIEMQDSKALENIRLGHRKAKEDKPELYYLSKFNKGLEQPLVTASFEVAVDKSGWYTLNYRGRTGRKGEFFKLWQNNTLVGSIEYDEAIDDKTSNRHKVYLEAGQHQLQLSVTREGWDFWSVVWLDFAEATS